MAYRSSRRAGAGHNFFRRRGQSVQRQERANVLQGTDVTFNLGGDVTGSQEMIDGNIFISSASIVSSGSAIITEHQTNNVDGWADVISILDVSGSVDYSSDIIGVKNGTTLVLRKPIVVEAISIGGAAPFTSSLEITKLPVIPFRLTYNRAPHFTTSHNYLSFAKVGLYDLSTFTGDVVKVKSYMQSSGDPTAFEYKLVEDTQLETTELLIDSGSTSTYDRIGLFLTSSIIENQWEVSATNTPNAATLAQDNDFIIAGMAVTSSYNIMTASDAALDAYYTVNHVQAISNIRPKTQYRISGDYHAIVGSGSQAQMDVYLSGSAFITANYTGSLGVHLGKFIFPSAGPSEVDDESGMLFSMIPMPFEPDEIGDAQVVYKISDGKWTLGDISLQAIQETGFSPGSTEILIPIRAEVDDRLNFKFEFYDINSNKANYEATSSEMIFQGPNTFIGGTGNVLSGSMVIGNATGSGIEMAGVSSGFIRSIGYEGFISASAGDNQAGFMIWSGSALPLAPDNYSDVGFELNAGPGSGSFKFRTKPSVLDIQADSFFVGTAATQFMSGSGGNIEISSSNFHLEPGGDVTMAGTITADAGNIGNWEISNDDIVGTNITMDATNSRIYKTDANDNLTGYYLDFTPGNDYYIRFGTNFAVSSSGVLFASGAKIEGVLTSSQGLIADWTIAPGVLSSVAATKYTGMSSAGDTRFFAGASSIDASGSAPFNVKATGELTASDYRFEGSGMITGSVIIGASATILGGLTAETIAVPTSLAPNFLAQITGEGFARFVSASIGGWEVDATTLVGGNVTLSSAGSIKVGTVANATTTNTTNSGLFADNSGNVLIKGNVADNNYLKIAGAGGIDIRSTTFNLATPTMVLDSSTSSGKIALGATPNTSISGTNKGFYVDGTGDFLLYGSATNYFKFDAAATAIDIKSDTFNLATTKMILDSATNNGKIALGATPPTAYNSGTGIYLDGTGKVLIGVHNGNRIQFDGTDFTVQVGSLELDATNIEISSTQKTINLGEGKIILSGAGTPTLKIGATAASNTLSAGSGVYFDGAGNFRLGDDDGNIKFENGNFSITGSDVDIKVTDINISSSAFELSSTQASMSLGSNRKWIASGNTTSPYQSIGQSTAGYGNTGVFLGYVNSVSRPKVSFVGSAGHFKFDQDVDIATGDFELAAANIQVSSNQASMSLGGVPGVAANITLDGANSKIIVGRSNKVTIQGSNVDNFIVMGSKTTFGGNTTGAIFGMDSGVPTFDLTKAADNYFRFDTAVGLDLKTSALEVSASNVQISSTHASMSIGDPNSTGGAVVLEVNGTDKMLRFGTKTTFDQDNVDGLIMGINAADNKPEIDFTVGTANDQYVRFTSGGVYIKVPNFELDTDEFDISSADRTLRIFSPSGSKNEVLRLGEISADTGDKYGLKIYDGTRTPAQGYSDEGHPNTLVMFGEQGNKVGGWEITNTQIRTIPPTNGFGGEFEEGETGLILHSGGRIESSDFVTGLKGWRIDTLGNGSAEFENARIRGTLATTVFEKESVNVVGGQLMIANSTTLQPLRSGSEILAGNASASNTEVTLSMANVSGFVAGEIIKAKRVGQTGFSVEYLQVTGSKRYSTDPALAHITGSQLDPDGLSGELYVGRGYGTVTNISESVATLDGAMSTTSTYSEEISIVLDIAAEKKVYPQDILKIDEERFKVISGSVAGNESADQTVTVLRDFHHTDPAAHSNGATVFKINGDNEFLQGLVSTAVEYNEGQVFVSTGKFDEDADLSSGYILMNANPNDISTPYMDIVERTGSGVYDLQLRTRLGDLSGLSSAYLYGEEEPGFGLYTENGFFKGTLHAMTGSIHGILNIATIAGGIETDEKISIGRNVSGTNDGIHINNNNYWYTDAEWRVGDATNYIHYDPTTLNIKVEEFELDAGSGDLEISSTQKSMSLSSGDIEFVSIDATQARGRIGSSTAKAIYISGSTTQGYIHQGKLTPASDAAGFWIGNDNGAIKFSIGAASDAAYIKYNADGNAGVEVKSETFYLAANTDDMILDSANKRISLGASQILLDGRSSGGLITVGSGDSRIYVSGSAGHSYIRTGKGTFASTTAGFWLGRNGTTTEFHLGDAAEYIKFDGSDLTIKSTHLDISAEDIDMTTTDFSLDADNLQIESSVPSMSLGYDTNVNAGATFVGGSPSYIGFGPKAGFNMELRSTTTDDHLKIGARDFGSGTGIILGSDAGTYKLEMYKSATEYFTYSSGGGFDLKTTKIDLVTGGGLTITGRSTTGANNKIMLGAASDISTGAGIFMDGGGAFRAGNPSGDYIKFTGSGNLDIVSSNINITATTFNLTANTNDLVIDSVGHSISLADSNIVLDGTDTGYMSIGTVTSATDTAGNNKGFYAAGDGNFITKAAANKYIQFNGGNLDIQTGKFNLNSAKLDINSEAGGSGSIALGPTPPTAYDTGAGFFVDGSGKFLLGDSDADHLSWSGAALTIKGVIRQTSSGATITDYVDRGTWTAATNNYAVNDLVQYVVGSNTSTYKCLVAHATSTNDNNATTGTPNLATTGWAIYVQGTTGATGITGAGTNFVFRRAATAAAAGTPTANGLNVPSNWYDDPPSGTDFLWSSKGTVAAGGTAYSWGGPVQVDGTVVAELKVYSNIVASNGASPDKPTASAFNCTTSALTIGSTPNALWNAAPPSVSNSGDTVYSCTALVSGSPSDTSVAITWSDPTIFARKTDGATGATGAGTNFVFARQTAEPATPTANGLNIPSQAIQWYDDPPTTPEETLWSSKGTVAAGGSAYVWGAVFQPEGTAVAEIKIYSDVVASNGASPTKPTTVQSFFNITTSALTIGNTDWNGSPPSVSSNGDTVYSCTALVSGSPSDTSVAVTWSDPTIFARKTDGATGAEAPNLTLTTSSNVFAFDNSTDTTPTPATITITATQANQASDLVDGDLATPTNGAKSAFAETCTNGTGQATWTVTPSAYPVTCVVTNDSLSDTVTIHKIVGGDVGDDGADAYTIILTNESHIVTQASSDAGSGFTFTGSGTDIIAYKGTTELTGIHDDTAVSAGYFSSSIAVSNVTADDDPELATKAIRYGDLTAMSSTAGSIVFSVFAESTGTAFTKTQSFTKSQAANDGDTGVTGAGTNFVFLRATTEPATPTADLLNVPSNWYDDPPATPLETLWGSKGTVAAGGSAYAWGAVFQVEGTAVAEVTIYKKASTVNTPEGGSYNFTSSTLSITGLTAGWVASIPALTANGDKVYASSGLFSGSPEATAATAIWATPVLYAQRTDGTSVTGDPGAGVVFRGEWEDDIAYLGNSNRIDVVKGSDNEYWMAKSDHTSEDGGKGRPIDGVAYATYWEEFGASFSSVATDILFADHVYADYTVNIGTNAGNPVIALVSNSGTNPYIGIGGATTFGTDADGIFIGYDGNDSNLAGLSLGTTFKAKAGGTTATTSLAIGTVTSATDTSNAGAYFGGDGKFLLSNGTDYLQFSTGNLTIAAQTFNLSTTNLIITDVAAAAATGKIVISGADQHIKVGTAISIDGDGDSGAGSITIGSQVTLNGSSASSIAGWDFDTEKLYKEHASENRRLEFDTNATIKDGDGSGNADNHTGQQAISMTSGSNYNAMVQMSNVETFINETDAYTTGEDYVIVEYDDVLTSNFTPYNASYQYYAATLEGEPAAGGGGEQN